MTTRSITRRGETLHFETDISLPEAIASLKGQAKPSEFLSSLLASADAGRLSPAQADWLVFMAYEKAQTSTAPNSSGPYLGLIAVVTAMQERAKGRVILRYPGITLKACTTGPNTGAIYLHQGDTYAGKITPAGVLKAFGHRVAELLEPILVDPVAAARAYGQESGKCSCCGRELEDPISLFGGIGPVCLKRLAGDAARKQLQEEFKAWQAQQLEVA